MSSVFTLVLFPHPVSPLSVHAKKKKNLSLWGYEVRCFRGVLRDKIIEGAYSLLLLYEQKAAGLLLSFPPPQMLFFFFTAFAHMLLSGMFLIEFVDTIISGGLVLLVKL